MTNNYPKCLTLILCLVFLTSCSVTYVDQETGEHHLWGFGHMKMKTAPIGDQSEAVFSSIQSLGVNFGVRECTALLTAGNQSETSIQIYSQNLGIEIQRPRSQSDIFSWTLRGLSSE